MPARQSQPAVLRTAVLALTLAVAACDSAESPLSPDAAEPLPPESVGAESVPAMPELLTAGTGPRILFSSARTGGTDLYRMAPDGSGVVRVTTFAGPDQFPAWSWDNNRIAFMRNRLDASNAVHQDIYLMNADGTGKRWARSVTTPYNITDPSWSKDGTRLVVSVWITGARSVGGTPYLALINVATGSLSYINAVTGGVIGYGPSFDPTGKKIVYAGQEMRSLEMINADGSGHQAIVASPDRGSLTGKFLYPAFSPDGKKVAYTSILVANSDIYVRTLVGGTTKALTTYSGTDMRPTWSADGTRIAFMSNRSGKNQIWTVPSNGGTQVRITNTSVAESSPAWSH
jgi:TolB protein